MPCVVDASLIETIPPETRGALVLVVNDEPIMQVLFRRLLEHAGFAKETLGDGASAIERRFRDPVPAVIVMNWWMPEMSGDEAIRLIRAREAAESLPRVPIVLQSASLSNAVATGPDVDATLDTPFDSRVLIDAVLRSMGFGGRIPRHPRLGGHGRRHRSGRPYGGPARPGQGRRHPRLHHDQPCLDSPLPQDHRARDRRGRPGLASGPFAT